MKLLVFSDSHGELSHMCEVIERERPDYVFHLGDYDSDAEELLRRYPMLPLVYVRGNCDYSSGTPLQRVVPLDGHRFFLCHGHRYGVKSGILRAVYAAREQNADVLLFGHTHEAYLEEAEDLLLMNPGSCGFGYLPSYGRILLENGKLSAELLPCDGSH